MTDDDDYDYDDELVESYTCLRCDHVWKPRTADTVPQSCPRCKSYQWDTPRKNPKEIIKQINQELSEKDARETMREIDRTASRASNEGEKGTETVKDFDFGA